MRARVWILGLCAAAAVWSPIAAASEATAVSAAEFRAFAEGWTLHFERDGVDFGAETFREGDRTLWRPAGGDCAPGVWRATDQGVCFHYGPETACWGLFRDARGLLARSLPDGATEVRVSRRDRASLGCEGDLVSMLMR